MAGNSQVPSSGLDLKGQEERVMLEPRSESCVRGQAGQELGPSTQGRSQHTVTLQGTQLWKGDRPQTLCSPCLPCSLLPVSCSCSPKPNPVKNRRAREATDAICAGLQKAQGRVESRCGETNERYLAQARLCGGSGEGLLPGTTSAEAQSICGSP